MSDWAGLALIVAMLSGALCGLSHLGEPPRRLTPDEFERRVKASQGWMSAGAAAGVHALQKLLNPKAADAVEVQKDLRGGFYDEADQQGDGEGEGARPGEGEPGPGATRNDLNKEWDGGGEDA